MHESPWSMTYPLIALAIPSVFIGFLGAPWNNIFAGLLDPEESILIAKEFSWGGFLPLAGLSVLISSLGILLAVLAYYFNRIDLSVLCANKFPLLNKFLQKKWYLDDINEKLFVQGSRKLAREVLEVDA